MACVKTIDFGGVEAVSFENDGLELVAISGYGPRIARLALPGGENLLLWRPGEYTRGQWDLRGGHRVWTTTPGADECEDTYAPDNGPCDIELFDDGFRLTGAKSELNATRRGLEVRLAGENRLTVEHFVTNAGNMLYAAGLWGLTCTLPGEATQYAIPLGDGHGWDTATVVLFREWAGQGQGGFDDPQIRIAGDLMLVDPAGVENKRALRSDRGIIAMSDTARDLSFAKKVDYDPAGDYPLGCNVAFYIGPDNFMVEMETMGPQQTLKPGQSLSHRETWLLQRPAVDFTTGEALEKMFA
jgi:hypothetical protein